MLTLLATSWIAIKASHQLAALSRVAASARPSSPSPNPTPMHTASSIPQPFFDLAPPFIHSSGILEGIIAGAVVTAAAALIGLLIARIARIRGTLEITFGSGEGGFQEPVVSWESLPDDPPDGFRLLAWPVRIAPLVGRETELEDLVNWAKSGGGSHIQIRLLTGPGGAGKTRLAAEVADRLRRDRSWESAGFFARAGSIKLRCPAFLVVDYPEDRREAVLSLLEKLSQVKNIKRPVRLLLLSRDSVERWIPDFDSKSLGLYVDQRELEVSRLSDVDAAALYKLSIDRLSTKYPRATKPKFSADKFAKWLESDREGLHRLPLLVTAAAIFAVFESDDTLTYSGAEIVQALARRELERLRKASSKEHGFDEVDSLARLIALAAIRDGLTANDLRRLADPVLELGLPDPERVVGAVSKLPWWSGGRWNAPSPHIVAAALTFEILTFREDMATEWLWAAINGVGPGIVDRLGRLVHDIGIIYGSEGSHQFVRWLVEMIDEKNKPGRVSELEFLASIMMPSNVVPLSIAVTRQLLSSVTDQNEDERAGLLNSLAVDLGEAGDTAQALVAIKEAVAIRRRLAQDQPARFEPDLAMSLNNLSIELSDTAQALVAIKEAVAIRRRLARDQPARFEPDLAMSLNNLSNRLNDAGDNAQALVAIKEAVAIYRRLAQDQPGRFEPDLASSLNNLSNRLSDAGDKAQALVAIKEAVAIYRRLAQDQPARFELDLAMSLNNLSIGFSDAGDNAQALVAIQEAVAIRRRLAQDQPARFEPDLASSLNNLSNRLSDTGDKAQALVAIQEAVAIYRRLAQAQSARFEPDLASSLNNLSIGLSEAGDKAQALVAIQEAVAIRQRLARDQPARFEPDLAMSLNNLSNRLNDAGDNAQALVAIKEAVAIHRRLAQAQSARFEPDLASSLNNLSIGLSDAGDKAQALIAIEEAVAIRRRLAQDQPARFAPRLIASLEHLALRLRNVGDETEAMEAEREAAEIRRGHPDDSGA